MSFEDIDTPVSEDELSGVQDPLAVEQEPESPEPELVEEVEEIEAKEVEPEQRSPTIPRARFDEVNSKLHQEREEKAALQAELDRIRQQAKAESPSGVDIDALEDQYHDAIYDGDKDKAKSLRSQINAELEARAERRAADLAVAEISNREANSRLLAVVGEVVKAYPFLDSAGPDAIPEAIAEVVEWRDFYMGKGMAAHEAVAKAAMKVAPGYAATDEPAKQDARKQAAMERNAKDSAAQPPANVTGIGNRATPIKPKIDTVKDWESLSAKEREEILLSA